MFFIGASEPSSDDTADSDKMKSLLHGLKIMNLELDWAGNKPEAFLQAVGVSFYHKSGIRPSSGSWKKSQGDSPDHDNITYTIIANGFILNASIPMGVIFHPECPQDMHEHLADGMLDKYNFEIKKGATK